MEKPLEAFITSVPSHLSVPLVEEYRQVLAAHRQRRWETVGLKAGKIAEITYVILRGYVDGHYASQLSKPKNMLAACLAFEREDSSNFPRSVRIQIPRLLISLYELRNNRSIGHVGGDVSPNEMDAQLFCQIVKWLISELIRVFHNVSIEDASAAVNYLSARTVPIIWSHGDLTRILHSEMSAKDKTLVFLYSCSVWKDIKEVSGVVEYRNITNFKSRILDPLHKSKCIEFDKKMGRVIILPVGEMYVERNIPLEI